MTRYAASKGVESSTTKHGNKTRRQILNSSILFFFFIELTYVSVCWWEYGEGKLDNENRRVLPTVNGARCALSRLRQRRMTAVAPLWPQSRDAATSPFDASSAYRCCSSRPPPPKLTSRPPPPSCPGVVVARDECIPRSPRTSLSSTDILSEAAYKSERCPMFASILLSNIQDARI